MSSARSGSVYPARSTPSAFSRVAQSRNPSAYARCDFAVRKPVECLSADTTSGQSSRTEPSTPR